MRAGLFLLPMMTVGAEAQPPASHAPSTRPSSVPRRPKSETTALAIPVAATAVGAGALALNVALDDGHSAIRTLTLATLAVAPSSGHFYSGATLRPVLTSTLRGAALVGFAIGMRDVEWYSPVCIPEHHSHACDRLYGARKLATTSGVIAIGLTILDLVDARGSARRANAEARWSITPTSIPSSSGNAFGLAFAGVLD